MKSKCENEAKKQDAVCDMTHEIQHWFILEENYVQKGFREMRNTD